VKVKVARTYRTDRGQSLPSPEENSIFKLYFDEKEE
jgi:hypothetical protein